MSLYHHLCLEMCGGVLQMQRPCPLPLNSSLFCCVRDVSGRQQFLTVESHSQVVDTEIDLELCVSQQPTNTT